LVKGHHIRFINTIPQLLVLQHMLGKVLISERFQLSECLEVWPNNLC